MARDKHGNDGPGSSRGLIGTLLEPANVIVQAIAQEVAPVVVAAVDVDGVVQQVDIQAIVDKVDIQAIVDKIDIQSIVEGLDIQAIIDHVDIGKVLESVDLNVVIERVDIDRVLDRVDVNKLIVRLDPNVMVVLLNLLLPQLDLNAIVGRLDFDKIVEKIDVNAIVARVDIDSLVQRTEIGAIVVGASAGVAGEVLDSVRSAGVGLDSFVQRFVDRILRRQASSRPSRSCHAGRAVSAGPVMTVRVEPDRDISLQGHYAGIVTRVAAFAIDLAVAATLYALGGRVIEYVLSSLAGSDVSLKDHPIVSIVLLSLWWLVYFAYPIAMSGRTLGMSFVGLEVVTKTGGDVDARHAVLRTIFLPISVAFAGIGILIIVINRDRRAFHDLIAGTAVVYSWDARAARLRVLAKRSVEELPRSRA